MRGKKKGCRRFLALVLAGVLAVTGLPGGTQVQAAEAEPVTVTTEKDVYVQGGGDANKVMTGSNIVIKTPESSSLNSTYHRRGLIEFDLTGAPEKCNTAVLKLQVAALGKQYNNTDRMAVYTTGTGWDASAMTWNKMPERTSQEPAASAYKANIDGNQGVGDFMCIDISKAVETALKNGETSISLELEFPVPQGGDHALYFYRHTAEGKTGPQLVLSHDAVKDQYDEICAGLRKKWYDYILGGELDLNDPTVSSYVASVHKTAEKYLADMNKSDAAGRKTLWNDLPITVYPSSDTGSAAKVSSGNVTSNFQRLKSLAMAYETKGGALYQNETLLAEIISGLDFMVDTYYNGTTSTNWGNWYHWEIGTPQALASTLIILQNKLTEAQLEKYMTGIERYDSGCGSAGIPGSPTMTGANLLDKALVVAQAGVLTNDAQKLAHVRDAQKSVYTYVTKDDGFYRDGSFIQHHTLSYTAGYGATLYGGIGVFFYMLDGTPWAIQYADGSEQMVYDTIFNSIEPLIYDMQIADSTAGRGIVRPTANTRTRAVGIVASILPIGASMKGEMKARFDSFVKDFIQTDEDYYFSHMGNITNIQLAKKIMNDSSVQPRQNYSVHKTYAGMDRVSHVRPDYMFNISMSSTRQSKFENYSDEGYKTWNIADGMTYLYTDELDQYTNDYWAVIDPFRLPGTTMERALTRKNFTAQAESGRTPYDWAGGVTLGTYGTAGVQMKSLGNETSGNGGGLTGADSKKSWFMFDHEIVAIGSSITSTTGNCVETVIDNRQIKGDLSNQVTVNGETPDITDNSANNDKHGTVIENAKWANIQGSTANSTIGYYFPAEGTAINALKEFRQSNYNTQSSVNKEASGGYATLWFDHGKNPSGDSYEYVILPGMNAEETAAYAGNPQIEVLANNDSVHAARHNGLGMTGLNFWKNETATAAGVTSDSQASVMMQQTDNTLEIAVSDPTQKNNGTIELTVDVPGVSVIAQDNTVTVTQLAPQVKISVNVAGSMGRSHTVKLELEVPVDKTGLQELYDEIDGEVKEGGLKESDYTAESWGLLTEALENAETVLGKDDASQDDVNAAKELLSGARNGLIAEKSKLQDLYDVIVGMGLKESDYTAESWGPFAEALGNAETVLGNDGASPADVTAAYEALSSARKGLITDNTKLQELYDEIKGMGLKESDYTAESWGPFAEALNKAEIVLGDEKASPSDVAEASETLKNAKEGLTADNTKLKDLYDEIKGMGLKENDYTAESWEPFAEALNKAETVLGNKKASPSDVAEACAALKNAKEGLVVDKAELRALYEEIKGSGLKGSDYTAKSWAVFAVAYQNAENVLENDASPADVAAAYQALKSAKEGLTADNTKLKDLYDEIKGMGLKESDYTAESWGPFAEALNKAETILGDDKASPADIAAAFKALSNAKKELKLVPKDVVDKKGLQGLYDEVKDLKESDYTAESWGPFAEAREKAKAVLDKDDASQAEVDEAHGALSALREGLIKADAGKPDPDSPATGDQTNLLFWVMMMVLAGGACAAARRRSRRKSI